MFTGTMLRHKSCLSRHNEEHKEDSLSQHKKKKNSVTIEYGKELEN